LMSFKCSAFCFFKCCTELNSLSTDVIFMSFHPIFTISGVSTWTMTSSLAKFTFQQPRNKWIFKVWMFISCHYSSYCSQKLILMHFGPYQFFHISPA
jgi:hypothetical protein